VAGARAQSPADPVAVYRQLASVELDPAQVYDVREGALDQDDAHFSFETGTLAFVKPVAGRVTGALFVGRGEVLVMPLDPGERASLAFFTGAAVLDEHFTVAFLRFADQKEVDQLRPALLQKSDGAGFAEEHDATVRALAPDDALRLLLAFTRDPAAPKQQMLRARVSGGKLGTFDVVADDALAEQINVVQVTRNAGGTFADVWLAFQSSRARSAQESTNDWFHINDYQLRTDVRPPNEVQSEAVFDATASRGGDRAILLALSHQLKVSSAEQWSNGGWHAVPWVQESEESGQGMASNGNDLFAVVLPQPLKSGDKVKLRVVYAGSVLTDAGNGLLRVGARGDWYPNRGLGLATFDMEFHCPLGWKLLATGNIVSEKPEGAKQEVTRWRSDGPIPLAGFNLGRYNATSAKVGDTKVGVFSVRGVETAMNGDREMFMLHEVPGMGELQDRIIIQGTGPPSVDDQKVLARAEKSLNFYDQRFGPYPYSSLYLTQEPGTSSHGWPGLIFLSSLVFMSEQDRDARLQASGDQALVGEMMLPHEIAHEWWGDAVACKSYRDEWLAEALANYSAVMEVETRAPEKVRSVLEMYRTALLRPGADGVVARDAGPVTLGYRLNSSKVPNGYTTITYGRGTWLIHMLREMFRNAQLARGVPPANADDLFISVLRGLQQHYRGKSISNATVQQAFEKALPPGLFYDGKPSLDWFFQGWVNGTAVPKFELRDVRFIHRGGHTLARAKLFQSDASDDLVTAVPIYAETGARRTIPVDAAGAAPTHETIGTLQLAGEVFADGNESDIQLQVPNGTTRLALDPHGAVLRQ